MRPRPNRVALWGGVECTVNRVGDGYHDQLVRSGHAARVDDLERFAALGIQTLRFPALWERHAPHADREPDWRWTDERLAEARRLGLRVIVGFLHHGSGPRYTDLLDPAFPERLATYAASFAGRYPWVEDYTPVNEPLTTARFSGLYGFWYPHRRDAGAFLRMLLTQCLGVAQAMRAVRRVCPRARLIQTEDLGRVESTPYLRYQAAFENERRWLSLDALRGAFGPEHALFDYALPFLRQDPHLAGLVERLQAEPCPPDVIGINHYVTSNRYLDEHLERYPPSTHGGNGRHRYADVEAVRVAGAPSATTADLLREAWQRYATPLAITETHLGCTREEQLRWLASTWRGAAEARAGGVDVRAVAAWALLGAFDWSSLVTRDEGHYEVGAFDVRTGVPRPTALAAALHDLGHEGTFDHPVLDVPGWWERPERFVHTTIGDAFASAPPARLAHEAARRPREILITGAGGALATAFAYACRARGLAMRCMSRRELDIADGRAVAAAIATVKPWAVINAAGYRHVDVAEHDRAACFRGNCEGAAAVAAACAAAKVRLLTVSSHLVFGGDQLLPYTEESSIAPLSVYGRSKADADRDVLARCPDALIVRSGAFFGPWDEVNFVTTSLRRLRRGEAVLAADDATISPTYLPDFVGAALDLLIDGASGTWHLANEGQLTWAELARLAARRHGADPASVTGIAGAALGWCAPRPAFSALTTGKGLRLPPLEHAIDRYARECRVALG